MIRQQQSQPLNQTLTIHLTGDLQLLNDDLDTSSSSIVVSAIDPISSIFDIIGIPTTRAKFIYNGQLLCPALSFSFYQIHDNDTIELIQPQTSNSIYEGAAIPLKNQQSCDQLLAENLRIAQLGRHNPICTSSGVFNKNKISCINALSSKEKGCIEYSNEDSNRNSSKEDLKSEYDRLTDIYRFRIESNTKSFRKLCSKYRTLINSESGFLTKKIVSPIDNNSSNKRLKGISSSVETVLPEKPMYPSTDFLPAFS